MAALTGNVAIDALMLAADAIEAARVKYAVTGSFAASYYGVVRATADADVKIEAGDEGLALIGERLRGSFRRIDETTFRYRERFDVELYPATNPLDREAIARRAEVALFPASARLYPIVTIEDLLLIKIREYLKYPDTKHVDDARRLLVANRRGLDVEYLETRLTRYGLMAEWERWVEGE